MYFLYCLELAFNKVLTIGIAMRNIVNYDSADPVPIGILMRSLVNYKCTVSCADRHRHAEPGEIQRLTTLCSCAVRHSYAESSVLQIGLGLANCADSSLFAGNRIRLPIGIVTLKLSKSNNNDETYNRATDCIDYYEIE